MPRRGEIPPTAYRGGGTLSQNQMDVLNFMYTEAVRSIEECEYRLGCYNYRIECGMSFERIEEIIWEVFERQCDDMRYSSYGSFDESILKAVTHCELTRKAFKEFCGLDIKYKPEWESDASEN